MTHNTAVSAPTRSSEPTRFCRASVGHAWSRSRIRSGGPISEISSMNWSGTAAAANCLPAFQKLPVPSLPPVAPLLSPTLRHPAHPVQTARHRATPCCGPLRRGCRNALSAPPEPWARRGHWRGAPGRARLVLAHNAVYAAYAWAVGPSPARVVRCMTRRYLALSHTQPRCRQQRLSHITRSLGCH